MLQRSATTICLAVALVLSACGGIDGSPGSMSDGRDGSDSRELACGDATFPEGELATMPTLDTLPDEVLQAADDTGEPALDTSLDWRVAEASEDEVVLIRAFDPAEPAAARGETHGTARVAPITGAPNIPDGTWFVWGGASCSPRLAEAAGDDQAEVRLAETPSADATELELLVREWRCASGRSAEGRIDLDELTLTDEEVRVRVSVRPRSGGQDCQGNPWTPFTVDLDEPLGDRTVVDAALVPARPLEVGTDEPSFDPESEDRDAAVERALSFDVWPDYTLRVETDGVGSGGSYEVVVREGEVVSRRAVDAASAAAGDDPVPMLAPSIAEALDRLRAAYDEDPDAITDIAVEESGLLLRIAFEPATPDDDEVAYRFAVDVDSPGDPVPAG